MFIAACLVAVALLVIFLWPKRPSAPPPPAIRRLLPESKVVSVEGREIHYLQAGRGPDLVLLHGIGASVFIWRFVMPLLETKFRVTAIDLPGFGQSSKYARQDYGLDSQVSTISKMLANIGIENADLVGSSMGGTIALWLAKREASRFPRVVALAPATDRRLVPAMAEYFVSAAPIFRNALNRRTMRMILGRVVARRDLITDEVIDAYLAPFLDRGESMRAFAASLKLLSDPRLPEGLYDIQSKILVVYGTRDMMVPRHSIDRLMTVLKEATLIIHEDGGHHIMEDEPTWTAQAIENFLTNREIQA